MGNSKKPEQQMPEKLRAAMEAELAKVAPMVTDRAAQASFEQGGPAYQATADRYQEEFQEAWRRRIRAAYGSQMECPGQGLSDAWFHQARFDYTLNFIFPKGTVERLVFEIGWENFVASEWDKLPETVKKVREEQEANVRRSLILGGAQQKVPMPPGFGNS